MSIPIKKSASSKAPKSASRKNLSKTVEIRDLIDFIAQSGLNEVNLETKDLKLYVKRQPSQKVMSSGGGALLPPPAPTIASSLPAQTELPAPALNAPTEASRANIVEIKSPMIGTFYVAKDPNAPPLVRVGDIVQKGQPICIIEAMKLFNEIESEVIGKIVRICVENASPVEFNQTLFEVEI